MYVLYVLYIYRCPCYTAVRAFTAVLLYCYTAILLYCYTAILLYCYTAVRAFTAVLLYCCTACPCTAVLLYMRYVHCCASHVVVCTFAVLLVVACVTPW